MAILFHPSRVKSAIPYVRSGKANINLIVIPKAHVCDTERGRYYAIDKIALLTRINTMP